MKGFCGRVPTRPLVCLPSLTSLASLPFGIKTPIPPEPGNLSRALLVDAWISPMQSRRLIFSGCLLIVAIMLLQALFGLTSSHVPLHLRPEVKRPSDAEPVRRVAELLRTENSRLRLDNERLRSAVDGHGEPAHLGQPQQPPPTEKPPAETTHAVSSWSESCCEGPAVAESAATGQAHVDCAVAPDEQRRQLLSYLDAAKCVTGLQRPPAPLRALSSTHRFLHLSPRHHPCCRCLTSVCRAATRARRGLPAANHTASGRPFIVLTHVLPGEEALLASFAAATAALRLPTVALAAHVEEVAAAAANISVQLVDEAELAAGQLKQAP